MSCCSYFESPSVFNVTRRRARKPHACCECGDAIQPGDTYIHSSGCWDGHWDAYSQCLACDAWADALKAAMRAVPEACDCILFGQLWEAIGEWTSEELGYCPMTGETYETGAARRARWAELYDRQRRTLRLSMVEVGS